MRSATAIAAPQGNRPNGCHESDRGRILVEAERELAHLDL
jgi:hypothetical protein